MCDGDGGTVRKGVDPPVSLLGLPLMLSVVADASFLRQRGGG